MPPEIRLGNPITPVGVPSGTFQMGKTGQILAEALQRKRELEQQDEALAERKRQFNLGQMSDLYSDFQNRAIQQKRIDAILEREDLRYKREGVRQRGLLDRLGERQDRIDTRTRETREAIAAQVRATQIAIGDRAAEEFERETKLKFEADVEERSRGRLTGEQAMQIAQESGLNTGEVVRRYERGDTFDFNDINKAFIKGTEADVRAVQADQNFNDSDKQAAFNGLRQKVAGINKEWIERKFDPDRQLDDMSTKSPYGDIVIWKPDPKNPGQHIVDKIMQPPDIAADPRGTQKDREKRFQDSLKIILSGREEETGPPTGMEIQAAKQLSDSISNLGIPIPEGAMGLSEFKSRLQQASQGKSQGGATQGPSSAQDAQSWYEEAKRKYGDSPESIKKWPPEVKARIREYVRKKWLTL